MSSGERRARRTLTERLWISIPLVIAWSVGCVVIAAVASQPATRAGELLMDPSFTLGSKWYTGLVSNLGILAWTVGAAAAFAGAWLCGLGGRTNARRFLVLGGFVGTLLLVDDLFMLHSVLLPAEFGLPKTVGQTLIGAAVVLWCVGQRREIRRTQYHLLVASAGGLAASYLVDMVFAPLPGDGWNIVEDGAKFLGVLAWATYFVVTTRDISRSVFVDALLTWPDDAYEKVYDELAAEAAEPAEPADATGARGAGKTGETSGARGAGKTGGADRRRDTSQRPGRQVV